MAQTQDNQPAQPQPPAAAGASRPGACRVRRPAEPQAELLKPEQLEALVAPIALYPDELLANVLAASTYPLEVVQADRWVEGEQEPEGRCAEGGGRQAGLGRQRQGAGLDTPTCSP